jgi:hypothetical protein
MAVAVKNVFASVSISLPVPPLLLRMPIPSRRWFLRVESLARQLQVLAHSLEVVERRIEQLAATFDDYAFFRALPGAGCAFAPRLLAAYGDNRSRWPSASALQCYCGIAPVTRQSGNTRCVVRRLHCPNFLRQSFHEWSAESWKHSRWARAFVRYHQSRGKSFHTIIRMLAYKWIKILTRAWHDRQLYDEERYLQCLIRRGSTGGSTVTRNSASSMCDCDRSLCDSLQRS